MPVPPPDTLLRGSAAPVTGAASRTGRATAVLLARAGASVAVTDVARVSAQAVADEIG